MKKISVGTDPEVFLKIDGKLTSAYGVIPGTKEEPYLVEDGAVQVDGMALEFNINPAMNRRDFIRSHVSVMKTLEGMLPDGSKLSFTPCGEFGTDYISKQPPEATILGCDPDYNAYTGRLNDSPNGEQGFRTASGHIHIGWRDGKDLIDPLDPLHFEECRMVVKELDATLGIMSTMYEPGCSGVKRRTLYGRAGAFRPKPYGVEYRVLSNFWLKNKKLMGWVYDTVERTMNQIQDLDDTPIYSQLDKDIVRSAIDSADRRYAQRAMTFLEGSKGYATL